MPQKRTVSACGAYGSLERVKAVLAVAIIPGQHHPQAIRVMVQHMMLMMENRILHSAY